MSFFGNKNGNKQIIQQNSESLISTFTYNIGDGLKKYQSTPLPKIVFWGDSITANGGDQWYSGFVQQFGDTLQLSKGSYYGQGYLSPNYGGVPSGWSLETKGMNQYRIVSTNGVFNFVLNGGWNSYDHKLDVFYSKESDGATFDIIVNDSVVQTINCNGTTTSYGNKVTVSIPAGSTYKIQAKGKTYIEGFQQYALNGASDGILVHKVGHGGFSATGFSDAEIEATIAPFNPDLTCIGHITNDYSQQNINVFKQKIEKAIQVGKVTGDVLIYIPCSGKGMYETNYGSTPYSDFKNVLYDLAKQYNCALVDFDIAFGGYYAASDNGFLIDDVHPNQKGYDYMTDVFLQVLAPHALPFRVFKINHAANVMNFSDLLINFTNVLGKIRVESPMYFKEIVQGVSSNGDVEHLKVSKLKITDVNSTGNYATLEKFGNTTGSVLNLRDGANNLQLYNAYGFSKLTAHSTLEIDTLAADKKTNHVKFKNRVQIDNCLTLSPMAQVDVPTNSMFVDSADNTLKFKNSVGVVKTINLT